MCEVYLLTVPGFNNLITWSGKGFFLELVIFGCYEKGLFGKLFFAFDGEVFSAALK